jgi:transcriptional regulator with XRE-family HTH domain
VSALAKRIDNIKARGDLSSREIAQLLDTHPQTVSRWNTGQSSPQPAALDQLLRLEWIIEQLAQFYAPDDARLWLFGPHTDLDGSRPADAIREGQTESSNLPRSSEPSGQ